MTKIKFRLSAVPPSTTAATSSNGTGKDKKSTSNAALQRSGQQQKSHKQKNAAVEAPDSDEEFPAILEEHCIFRLPSGDPVTERLKKKIQQREELEGLEMNWHGTQSSLGSNLRFYTILLIKIKSTQIIHIHDNIAYIHVDE
jgi:hypothetical protein